MKGMLPKALWFIIPFYKWIEYKKTNKYSKSNSIESLENFKGNVVIIHSTNDKVVKFIC